MEPDMTVDDFDEIDEIDAPKDVPEDVDGFEAGPPGEGDDGEKPGESPDEGGNDTDHALDGDAPAAGADYDYRTEQELASIETEFERLAQQAAQLQQMVDVDPVNYDSEADYNHALMEASAAMGQLRALEGSSQGLAQKLTDLKVKAWQTQVEKGRREIKDFEEVLSSRNFAPESHVAEMLARHPQGYRLAYQLAKRPADLRRVNGLPPMAAAMELGRLSALGTTRTAPVKKVSQAPKPVKPVRGRPAAAADASWSQLEKALGYR